MTPPDAYSMLALENYSTRFQLERVFTQAQAGAALD